MQSQFTDKAQHALSLATKCARKLKQGYVGSEHILVGLIQEETGVAGRVLSANEVDVTRVLALINELIVQVFRKKRRS